jgi:hypothetical protein
MVTAEEGVAAEDYVFRVDPIVFFVGLLIQ